MVRTRTGQSSHRRAVPRNRHVHTEVGGGPNATNPECSPSDYLKADSGAISHWKPTYDVNQQSETRSESEEGQSERRPPTSMKLDAASCTPRSNSEWVRRSKELRLSVSRRQGQRHTRPGDDRAGTLEPTGDSSRGDGCFYAPRW